MRFQRAGPDTGNRRQSFEIDRFGQMAAQPAQCAHEISGQRPFRYLAGGPVVVQFGIASRHCVFFKTEGAHPPP